MTDHQIHKAKIDRTEGREIEFHSNRWRLQHPVNNQTKDK